MTRRELLKRTTNYIEEYTVIVGFQGIGALAYAAYYKEHAEHFSWYVPSLVSIISLMIINTIFAYYYVYDILKKIYMKLP